MAHYKLLTKQREFMEIPHEHKLDVAMYQGGFGSGKTWCGSLLGIMLARKYPGSVGLVGAKEYELVRKTTLVSYIEHLDLMGYKDKVDYNYNKQEKVLKFKNGSKIFFMGLEDPEKFKSLNLHWAEIEEASQVPDSAFKQLIGRLRNTTIRPEWGDFRYRLFGHTNPQPNKGWIYKRFVEKPKENYRLIIAPTSNNTYLPKHYIESMKEEYDPEYYRINVLGEFGDYSSGLVVKGFTDENICEYEYDPTLPLHLTCDFNVDPMCWVIAQRDEEEGKIYFFDELVMENTDTQRCINEFMRRYKDHKGGFIINGDAAGDWRNTQSEFTNYTIIKRTLERMGYDVTIRIRDCNPPILRRIQSFNARVVNANGERFVFVSRKCKWFLHNIYNLAFKEGTSVVNVPTAKQIEKDRDLKFLEHPFDAGSYLVEYYHPIK